MFNNQNELIIESNNPSFIDLFQMIINLDTKKKKFDISEVDRFIDQLDQELQKSDQPELVGA